MKYCAALVIIVLAGCASTPPHEEPATMPATPPPQSEPQSKGGYYKDDGPEDNPPANLAEVPDAQPKAEPLHRWANRPYTVFGRHYVPAAQQEPFRQRGLASWYGRRFHRQKTASGEPYDMYAMSAAHPTLPIPSYVRVTHLGNGRSVVVRINDRGPFHPGRIIDLSYAAAFKLGFINAGSAQVEVESIIPGQVQHSADAGIFLQVGAFTSRANADSLRERLARELAWLQETVQVFMIGSLWRLHLGPYRSHEDARSIAERIEAQLNLKPLVIVR